MEGDGEVVALGQDLAPQADLVAAGDAGGGVFADGAVDADFSLLDEAIGLTAGQFGARGNEFVEANFVFHFRLEATKKRNRSGSAKKLCWEGKGLAFSFCFRETDGALAFFPLATLFEDFDAFETLHD